MWKIRLLPFLGNVYDKPCKRLAAASVFKVLIKTKVVDFPESLVNTRGQGAIIQQTASMQCFLATIHNNNTYSSMFYIHQNVQLHETVLVGWDMQHEWES